MILIGMLHNKKDPSKVRKAYAYAAAAILEGAEFIYFSPQSIDLDKKVIHGYKYDNNRWVKVQERYPDVIYNTGLSAKLAKYKKILKPLKRQIPFTSHPIGDKLTILNKLKESKECNDIMIPSFFIQTVDQLFEYLNKYSKIVLKSNRGHRGQGVMYIERVKNQMHVMTLKDNYYVTKEEFVQSITNQLNEKEYHVQPYIESQTNTGQSFILRLHVQKNGKNEWVLTSVYPEIAPIKSVIANLNYRGTTCDFADFITFELEQDSDQVYRLLERLSIQVATIIEQNQSNHIWLNELGIDVGIDRNGKIWIYEINSLPGPPPNFNLELDVVRNQIQYAIFLAKRHKEKEAK